MKRALFSLCLLLLSMICLAQNDPKPAFRPLFADQPRFVLVEGRSGRSFLKTEDVEGTGANVFFGGAEVDYGVALKSSLLGVGASFEYFDLIDNASCVPLYFFFRQYDGTDSRNGLFVGVKAGYSLGGNKSFSTIKELAGFQPLSGTTQRSLNGPFGEVQFEYSVQRFDIFIAYQFRVIHYDTKYIYVNPWVPNYDVSWKRSVHTVMGGVGFRLF